MTESPDEPGAAAPMDVEVVARRVTALDSIRRALLILPSDDSDARRHLTTAAEALLTLVMDQWPPVQTGPAAERGRPVGHRTSHHHAACATSADSRRARRAARSA